MPRVIINTDGASHGNPGPAGIGAVIRDEQGRVIARISRAIGITTNNQAEYRAIIAALEKAKNLGVSHVELRTDSELIVRQMSGRYQVKEASLKPLFLRVQELRGKFLDCTFAHVPGEENEEAHKLADLALKRQ